MVNQSGRRSGWSASAPAPSWTEVGGRPSSFTQTSMGRHQRVAPTGSVSCGLLSPPSPAADRPRRDPPPDRVATRPGATQSPTNRSSTLPCRARSRKWRRSNRSGVGLGLARAAGRAGGARTYLRRAAGSAGPRRRGCTETRGFARRAPSFQSACRQAGLALPR